VSRRIKTEVSEAEYKQFLAEHPDLEHDGVRHTERVKLRGGHWLKPLAAKVGNKFYLLRDA
jgi:hypothetical protein